jgi:hypothetical protein
VDRESWAPVRVEAEVSSFEDAGQVKYDFNHEAHLEAATVLKILSPVQFRGTMVRYFHRAPVPADSFWRKLGTKIEYSRPQAAIPGDMGLQYGEIEARVLSPTKDSH